MTDPKPFDRSYFVPRIFVRLGGGMFVPPGADDILPLGDRYQSVMRKIYVRREKIFSDIARHLSGMSNDELQLSFSADGRAISNDAKAWMTARRQEINSAFGRLSEWYLAPLFRTKNLADFDHWSRSAFFTLDEIVWLSVGLEPADCFKTAIEVSASLGKKNKLDDVGRYMGRHREQLRREFKPYSYSEKVSAKPLIEWIERVNFPVHPGFFEMLSTMTHVSQCDVNADPVSVENTPTKLDNREIISLAKLITAMAIDGYGYDPTGKRSPIPNEITAITDRLGLSVSNDTVRKYLKLGAEHLPESYARKLVTA